MIKNDIWIDRQVTEHGLIYPYIDSVIRESRGIKRISYGLSGYGYDIRLSPKDFKVFRHIPGQVINPKKFNYFNLESVTLHEDEFGEFFIIPANSYALGVSLERISMPTTAIAVLIGKSTYARCGIICNCTPINAGWEGHITLEFSNSSTTDCRIYANEGVAQLLFFEGDECAIPYSPDGNYQNQTEKIELARV